MLPLANLISPPWGGACQAPGLTPSRSSPEGFKAHPSVLSGLFSPAGGRSPRPGSLSTPFGAHPLPSWPSQVGLGCALNSHLGFHALPAHDHCRAGAGEGSPAAVAALGGCPARSRKSGRPLSPLPQSLTNACSRCCVSGFLPRRPGLSVQADFLNRPGHCLPRLPLN